MPVTPGQFKAEYVEFGSVTDPVVQSKLDEAYLRVGESWGDLRDVGVKKLTAHLLWISPLTEPAARTSDGKSDYLADFEALLAQVRVNFFGTVSSDP